MTWPTSVLIIDNDPISNYMTKTFFESIGSIEKIHFTTNGKLALKFIEKNYLPELILLDLYTPVMDGFEFIEELKERNIISRTNIIFYTTDYWDRLKKYDFNIINKPLTLEKFHNASQAKESQSYFLCSRKD